MAKYSFALEKGQPARLEIETKYDFEGGTVKFDGNPILEIPDKNTFSKGFDVSLPDGSSVQVVLQPAVLQPFLMVSRNGEPLFGSKGDTLTRIKYAAILIYIVAGLSMITGLLAILFSDSFLSGLGLGWSAVVAGAVFALLGYLTERRMKSALIIAMVLYAADGFLTVYKTTASGESPSIVGVVIRVLLILGMLPGVKAIDEIRAEDRLRAQS